MRVHLLGIGGTFMAGLACLAKQLGHDVEGSDTGLYPPMSDQLANENISVREGYLPENLSPQPDLTVIGNAISRGNPALEHLLNKRWPYISGPQYLAEHLLQGRTVLTVTGTHGKSTTSSLLAWILEFAGLKPGFLIGAIPNNFGVSARLGDGDCFVIEGDEYDTAFFDKRSKFLHYRPWVTIINNLEYDHADIFPDLAAIQNQFHHLLRALPSQSHLITPVNDSAINAVIAKSSWAQHHCFSLSDETVEQGDWFANLLNPEGSHFQVFYQGKVLGEVSWALWGKHNVKNALAALSAAQCVGVEPAVALEALASFKGLKRRMEYLGKERGVTVYSDFAHHPTAIGTTLEGLRARVGQSRIFVILDCASYSMRTGIHQNTLPQALSLSDHVTLLPTTSSDWAVHTLVENFSVDYTVASSRDDWVSSLAAELQPTDHVLFMSNGNLSDWSVRLLECLAKEAAQVESL